jgi:heme-degrading monooxygenase HmoA
MDKKCLNLIFLLVLIAWSCNMENKDSKSIYTLGIWVVKSGNETAFINEWTSFANWTSKNISGAGKGYLLQDKNNPIRFISFGPWDNEKSIENWRNRNEFEDFVSKVKVLCDDFQPNTLKVVSKSN